MIYPIKPQAPQSDRTFFHSDEDFYSYQGELEYAWECYASQMEDWREEVEFKKALILEIEAGE